MSFVKDIPFRGSFDPSNQPFIMIAYANTTVAVPDKPAEQKNGAGWYLLTSATYGNASGSNNDSIEAVFTPFLSGQYNPEGTNTDNFMRLYNCDFRPSPNPSCDYQSADSSVWLPSFSTDPFTSNPYIVKNVQPMVMKATSVGNGAWQFYQDSTNLRLRTDVSYPAQAYTDGQQIDGNSPYDAATFIKKAGSVIDKDTTYLLSPQTQLDANAIITTKRMFAGYPYRIVSRDFTNSGAIARDVFPFRDFNATTYDIGQAITPIYSRETNLNGYVGAVTFRGIYYNDANSQVIFNKVIGPSGEEILNFGNLPVNSTNQGKDTVQVYFLPVNYYSSNSGNQCPSAGGIINLIKEFYSYIYSTPYTGDCNASPNLRPSYCSFTTSESCNLNNWYNYCLSDTAGCGACYGGCNDVSVSLPYCVYNPAYSGSNPNIFACAAEVDPSDPMFPKSDVGPSDPGGRGTAVNSTIGWVVSASIFFVVILVCIIIVLKFK